MANEIKTRVGVDDRASAKLNKAAQSVSKYGRAWQTTSRMTGRAMRIMDRGFDRLGRAMRTLTRRAKFMLIGFQLTATIMATSMVRSALKYERALRNVTSLMAGAGMSQPEIEKNFKRMDGAIRRMAVNLGQAPEDLAAGMYQVVSATFDGESGMKVLETAAKGALAGLSDTNTTTGLLTKTLQAYRKEGETNAQVAEKSTDVMDTYFMAVNRGMFTFDDLANKMGALPSTAAAFGVSLDDMMGFLSTATIRGQSLDEAIVGVRQAMLQIGKTTPQTAKAAEELFGKDWKDWWSAEGLAKNGLFQTLQKLTEKVPGVSQAVLEAAADIEDSGGDAMAFLAEKTGSSVEALAALFPNIRALKAILAVSGPGMALYAENMDFMGQRAGSTQRALEEMEKSGALAMDKFKSMISVIGLDVGGLVLPALTTIGNSMIDWYGNIQQDFAREGGLFENDAWLAGVPDSEAESQMKIAAQQYWDNASPGERLTYTMKRAWTDAMANLKAWFDGGGKEKIEGVAKKFGDIIAGGLRGLAGLDGGDISDSLPSQFGRAMLDGFTSAFKDFDWEGFFKSTFGAALTTVIAGIFGGPGAAIGAFTGAKTGMNPLITGGIGMLLWKLLPGMLAGGGGAAAGGAGAAGAAGAVAAGAVTLSASSVIFTAAASLAAGYAFAKLIDYLIPKDGNEGVNGGSAEISAEIGANTQARVDAGVDPFQAINENMGVQYSRPGGYGLSMGMATPGGLDFSDPFGGKVWDAATGTFVEGAKKQDTASTKQTVAANRMDRATRQFGAVVASMPGMIGMIGGISDGAISTRSDLKKTKMAIGGQGTVRKPTLFMAGEAGAEDFSFTPRRNGGGSGGGGGGVTIGQLTVTSNASDPKVVAAAVVRELEKAVRNG